MINNKSKVSKQLIKEWNQHISWLKSSCVEVEDPKTKNERIELALKDYQYFVKTYFNHYVTYNGVFVPNNIYQNDVAYKLYNENNIFIAAKWSRGFGKSSHCSLFIPIWLLLNHKTNHILLISKNLDSASKLLSHIQGELEFNQQLIKDFSLNGLGFKTSGDWSRQSLVVSGYNTAINCGGRGQDLRGIRYGSTRPQTIILDDLDDSQLVMNQERVNDAFDWLRESVIGTLDIKNFKVVYVENLYAKNSLFNKYLTEIKDLYVSEVAALNSNNESNWPERFTTQELLFIRDQIGSISFNREYMNNPILSGSVFKTDWFKYGDIKVNNNDLINIYCDLSFSDSGDYKGVSVMTKRGNNIFLLDLYGRKGSVNSVMYWLYDIYDKYHNLGCPVYLYLEAVFGQDKIYEQFNDVANEKGYRLPFIMDKSVKINKYNRIELSSVWFERGLVYISTDIENTQDVKVMLEQYMGFGEGSKKNDDIPDSIASNIDKLNSNTRVSKNTPLFDNHTENIKF